MVNAFKFCFIREYLAMVGCDNDNGRRVFHQTAAHFGRVLARYPSATNNALPTIVKSTGRQRVASLRRITTSRSGGTLYCVIGPNKEFIIQIKRVEAPGERVARVNVVTGVGGGVQPPSEDQINIVSPWKRPGQTGWLGWADVKLLPPSNTNSQKVLS